MRRRRRRKKNSKVKSHERYYKVIEKIQKVTQKSQKVKRSRILFLKWFTPWHKTENQPNSAFLQLEKDLRATHTRRISYGMFKYILISKNSYIFLSQDWESLNFNNTLFSNLFFLIFKINNVVWFQIITRRLQCQRFLWLY